MPPGARSSSASSSTITSGASVRAGAAMGLLYSLAVLESEAQRLLGGERHRARVSTVAAAADRLGVEVVDQERPVHRAGEAGAAGERGRDQAGVVVAAEAGQLEGLLHVRSVQHTGGSLNRAARKPPVRGVPLRARRPAPPAGPPRPRAARRAACRRAASGPRRARAA